MQLALLLGANPRTIEQGPIVRLPAGSWTIRSQGVNSSVLELLGSGSPREFTRMLELDLTVATDVRVRVSMKGVEDYITVLAES